MSSLNPYLTFDGNCEEAFDFYRIVFGGEFDAVNRYSEMPPDVPSSDQPGADEHAEMSGADEHADKIMHISLSVGEGQALMGSDRPPGMGSVTFGDSISVSLAPNSAEAGARIFEALAAGGQVTMPYERQFWGADYGMCIDRFGIHWMVNYQSTE